MNNQQTILRKASEFGVSAEALSAANELITNYVPEYIGLEEDPPMHMLRDVAQYIEFLMERSWQAGYEAGREEAIVS